MGDRVLQIADLCQAWVDEIVQPDGSVVIAVGATGSPLATNGIYPHNMTHAELRATCLGLINILSVPTYQMIGTDDRLYLGWCAQVLDTAYGYFQPRSQADIELRTLFMATVHASLADPGIVLAYEQNAATLRALPTPTRQALALIQDHFTVSAYLCFPLLEGVLRRTLSEFVERDGTVLKDFSVCGRDYGPKNKFKQCNNVAHMLFQLETDQKAKTTDLHRDLTIATAHLRNADASRHPYDVIAHWRNSSLHGNVSLATIGARVLNLVTLIALHNLIDLHQQPTDYEDLAKVARQAALAPPRDMRWSYYPRDAIEA